MKYTNPKILFHGSRIDLLSIEIPHPKGAMVQREIISHPGAVVILPILDAETALLIRNERYVVQERLWELPAGTLEEGEDPQACALRELEEETGYQAGQIEHFFDCYTTPGFCNEKLFVYIARDLTPTQQSLDETEEIEAVPLKWNQIISMIRSNEIRDAKTIAALLNYYINML